MFHHIKDHRPASGGAFDGDASMGMFPQRIDRLGAQSYAGLSTETIAVTGANAELPDVPPADAIASPNATGAFLNWDAAHHTIYGYMMAFVEGERYLADAVLDQLSYLNMQGSFDGFVSNPPAIWALSPPRRDLVPVPNTPTYGFSHLRTTQERSFGWSQYSWDHAYALLADDDRHKPFLERLQQTTSDLLEDSVAFFPASQLETGTFWMRNRPFISAFMNSLSCMLFERSNILTEGRFPGHVLFNNLLARYLNDTLVHNPYASRFQNHMVVIDDINALNYIERDERWVGIQASIDNESALGSTFVVPTNGFEPQLFPAENEECYIADDAGRTPVPPELSTATIFYLVNVAINENQRSGSWQLAATPGGSPITVTSQPQNVSHFIKMASLSDFGVLGENGALVPPDDNFMTIMNAAVEYHFGARGSETSEPAIQSIRSFFAPKTYDEFANWNLNGDLMR